MRIGLFTDTYSPEINGVVSSIVTLQKELEKNGHTVFVITTNDSVLKASWDNNILRLPGFEIKKLYGYRLSAPIHLLEFPIIKEMNLDIIHAHTEFGVGIFARIVAKVLRIPIVYTYHTMYQDYTHYLNPLNIEYVEKVAKQMTYRLSKLYGSNCTELISPSEKTKQYLESYGIKKNIHVIPTGLDLSRFSIENTDRSEIIRLRKELGLNDSFTIVFIGRVAKEKRIDLLIDGFELVKNHGLDVKLLIVGDGPYREHLEDKVEKLKLKDHVIFAGKKSAQEVSKYYHLSDAFASASLSETQGMTYIEAMASDKIVFASYDENLKDLLQEEKTGYWFNSAEEFYEKIVKCLNLEPEKRAEMIAYCKNVVRKYSSEYFYEKIIGVYQEAIKNYYSMYEVIKMIDNKSSESYLVEFKNKVDSKKVLVNISDIIEYDIHINGYVSMEVINKLMDNELLVKMYDSAIKKISYQDYSVQEIREYLGHKFSVENKELIELVIKKLINKKYLNDHEYALNKVRSYELMLYGKDKIKNKLIEKKISNEIIEEVLKTIDHKDEVENAIKLIQKNDKALIKKSRKAKIMAIKDKLYRQGFAMDVIEEALNKCTIEKNEVLEIELLKQEIRKLMSKYGFKYPFNVVKQKIIANLLKKGFDYDDIKDNIEESEDNDEIH